MLSDRIFYEFGLLAKHKDKQKEITHLKMVSDDPVTFELNLLIKTHTYHFLIIFPRYFPNQPIIIKSLEQRRISKHQYNDKTMCLKWGIDNWHEDITVVDMVENLIELLTIENPYGDTHGVSVSGDKFTFSQQINSKNTLIVDEDDFKYFKDEGKVSLIQKLTNRYGVMFINKIDKYVKGYFLDGEVEEVEIKYIKINFDLTDDFDLDENIRKYLEEYGNLLLIFRNKKMLILYRRLSTEKEKEQIIKNESLEKQAELKKLSLYIVETVNAKYLNDEKEKRLKIKKTSLKKKIAILGLGSVGSRVLMDLARAGFSNFILVDEDIFMPNNLLRHELDVNSIGEYKINALSKRIIKGINSKVKFSLHHFALNGQESTETTNKLLQVLSNSDLIIDCTADSNLIFSLNEIVDKNNINYISGSVISGGLGNILIIKRGNDDISLIDLVESQKKFFRVNFLETFLTNDYSGRFNNREYVASMSDISIISGLIGKNAINMLDNKNEIFKSNIYISSTSNSFLNGPFDYYSLNANKRNYKPKDLDKMIIQKGKHYYENNYSKKNNHQNI